MAIVKRYRRVSAAVGALLLVLLAIGAWPISAGRYSQEATAASAAAQAGEQQESDYAGSEACAACHEGIRPAGLIQHKILETAPKLKWTDRSCEACHGPGKAHAESADSSLIFSFKQASATRVSQQCLTCHAQALRANAKAFDAHTRNDVSCVGCHSVHTPKVPKNLLVREPVALCNTCHTNVVAEFNRPFRHRLPEGAIRCVDCHNPHGSPQSPQLQRASANDIACFKCHGNLRGPFAFEHIPVRTDGCQACHEPHGSVNPRLLRRSEERFLCLECHTATMTTLGNSPPAFHDLRSARFQNCTSCHQKIHGSYVDPIFER